MKRIVKSICIALATVLAMSSVSSCNLLGNLDDMGVKAEWKEEGNKMIYEATVNYLLGTYTQVLTFVFTDDVCTQATGEFIFQTAQMAQEFYNELTEEEKEKASIQGKKVTIDLTESYSSLTKTELKTRIEESGGWSTEATLGGVQDGM